MEEVEVELRTLTGKYEGLREKYENLSALYMDLLKQKSGSDGHAEWRPEDVSLGGERGVGMEGGLERELEGGDEMLGQEFDVSELFFGAGNAGMEPLGV